MLRGRVAVGTGRAHQESRRAVRTVQLFGRAVPEEARQAAQEPCDRGVERLCRRVDRRFAAGDIHQLQVAQAVAVWTAAGRTGSADADHPGETRPDRHARARVHDDFFFFFLQSLFPS